MTTAPSPCTLWPPEGMYVSSPFLYAYLWRCTVSTYMPRLRTDAYEKLDPCPSGPLTRLLCVSGLCVLVKDPSWLTEQPNRRRRRSSSSASCGSSRSPSPSPRAGWQTTASRGVEYVDTCSEVPQLRSLYGNGTVASTLKEMHRAATAHANARRDSWGDVVSSDDEDKGCPVTRAVAKADGPSESDKLRPASPPAEEEKEELTPAPQEQHAADDAAATIDSASVVEGAREMEQCVEGGEGERCEAARAQSSSEVTMSMEGEAEGSAHMAITTGQQEQEQATQGEDSTASLPIVSSDVSDVSEGHPDNSKPVTVQEEQPRTVSHSSS